MKFLKFLFSGLFTYAINIGLTYLLIEVVLFEKTFSYAISIVLTTIVNLVFSLFFTFKTKYSHRLGMKYILALITFSFANFAIVDLLKNMFEGNWYYVLIFLVTTGLFFLKYKVYDIFVFK